MSNNWQRRQYDTSLLFSIERDSFMFAKKPWKARSTRNFLMMRCWFWWAALT